MRPMRTLSRTAVAGVAFPRGPKRQHRVEDCAEREDVTPFIHEFAAPPGLFRRHERRRADDVAVRRDIRTRRWRRCAFGPLDPPRFAARVRFPEFFREPPVHDQCFTEVADHHVRRLEVPVDHTLGMRVGHAQADVLEHAQQPPPASTFPSTPRRRPKAPAEMAPRSRPRMRFMHRNNRALPSFPGRVPKSWMGTTAGVVEPRSNFRLARESFGRPGGDIVQHQFHRDFALEVAVVGLENPAEPAARDLGAQLVAFRAGNGGRPLRDGRRVFPVVQPHEPLPDFNRGSQGQQRFAHVRIDGNRALHRRIAVAGRLVASRPFRGEANLPRRRCARGPGAGSPWNAKGPRSRGSRLPEAARARSATSAARGGRTGGPSCDGGCRSASRVILSRASPGRQIGADLPNHAPFFLP